MRSLLKLKSSLELFLCLILACKCLTPCWWEMRVGGEGCEGVDYFKLDTDSVCYQGQQADSDLGKEAEIIDGNATQ